MINLDKYRQKYITSWKKMSWMIVFQLSLCHSGAAFHLFSSANRIFSIQGHFFINNLNLLQHFNELINHFVIIHTDFVLSQETYSVKRIISTNLQILHIIQSCSNYSFNTPKKKKPLWLSVVIWNVWNDTAKRNVIVLSCKIPKNICIEPKIVCRRLTTGFVGHWILV